MSAVIATKAPASRSAEKARKAAHAAQYAPRKVERSSPAVAVAPVDVVLRKLTSKTLDALKMPGAIPSNVIFAALKEAQDLAKAKR